jgi:hypothetical protein
MRDWSYANTIAISKTHKRASSSAGSPAELTMQLVISWSVGCFTRLYRVAESIALFCVLGSLVKKSVLEASFQVLRRMNPEKVSFYVLRSTA